MSALHWHGKPRVGVGRLGVHLAWETEREATAGAVGPGAVRESTDRKGMDWRRMGVTMQYQNRRRMGDYAAMVTSSETLALCENETA